jgi:hypothetical protein
VIGPISDTANSAVVLWARYARGDRLELPDWLCPGSALRATRSSRRKRSWATSDQARWTVSKRSEIVSSKEAARIPEKERKTALAIVKDRPRSAAGWTAGGRSALIVPRKRGNSPRRTPWREARRQSAGPTEGKMPNTSRFIRMSTGLGRVATGTLRGRRSCRLRNRMLSCEPVRV